MERLHARFEMKWINAKRRTARTALARTWRKNISAAFAARKSAITGAA
jgi:hypothetical protein